MSNVGNTSNLDKIQRGVKETERLLGQKQYNASMVKARQTLEQMVRLMGERACIVDSDLAESIDQLYHGRWISKTSCEHYHKIRMTGNRAVHEEHEDAYDANQTYNLLAREYYTFANDYNSNNRQRRSPASSANRTPNRGRKRTKQRKNGLSVPDFLKILLPVLCILILILILVIWLKPNKEKPIETTAEPTTEITTLAPPTVPPETQPTTAAPTYKTSDALNIRKEPSTNSAKIGVLPPGTSIDFVRKYDDFWSVINFNGQEGYVASQYITTE